MVGRRDRNGVVVARLICIGNALLLSLSYIQHHHKVMGFSPRYPACPIRSAAATTKAPSRLWLFDNGGGGSSSGNNEKEQQAVEAMTSLLDFHPGSWTGIARSFAVTNDVMAGVVQRHTSAPYTVTVQLSPDALTKGYMLTESIYPSSAAADSTDTDIAPAFRKISLSHCNMDVDSVDASYSLDTSFPDFPTWLSGTGTTTDDGFRLGIEHCLATSDNSRSRCFAFYGTTNENETTGTTTTSSHQLKRIVVCHEERQQQQPQPQNDEAKSNSVVPQEAVTMRDLLELQSDVDRLVDKIVGSSSSVTSSVSTDSSGDGAAATQPALSRHDISLLEISSGIWSGDSVIRDNPTVPTSPFFQTKGFGASSPAASVSVSAMPFGWSVGVQKVAWRWMWNFGEEVRCVVEAGRSMGTALAEPLTKSLAGSVCVNEGLSRRILKNERMVYIDWDEDNVGFVCGSVSIQVPRYFALGRSTTSRLRPLYTEFAVYQAAEVETSSAASTTDNAANDVAEQEPQLPELICSKIARLYNYEGKLKQGVSSFFTLQRFGNEE